MRPVLLIAAAFLMVSCGSKPKNTASAFQLIVFGENGGVVGQGPQYGLSGDGVLIRSGLKGGDSQVLGQVSPDAFEEISKLVLQLKKVDDLRQETANLNRKVLIQSKSGNQSFYWHMPPEGVPAELLELYQQLSRLPAQLSE